MSNRTFTSIAFALLAMVLAFGGAGALIGGQQWQDTKQFLDVTLPVAGFVAGWALFSVGRED